MRILGLAFLLASGTVACAASSPSAQPPSPTDHASASAQHAPWTYSGETGPEHWGDLDPSFGLCSHGVRQAPIDLPAHAHTEQAPPLPQWTPVPLRIVNTGHTVQVEDTAPSSFTVGGTSYSLAQFHFHSPAEHTIAGHAYDAEMHLVHKSADGKLLVVGILFTTGTENAVLKPVWDGMPAQTGGPPVTVPNVAVDVASLLSKSPRYLRYDGSLTVPPCTEGVTWLVVEPDERAPAQLSAAQIDKLRAATHGPTNRPIQPLHDRIVTELVP